MRISDWSSDVCSSDLRKRLPELVARLAAVDGIDDLAVTTNAALLAKQARALCDAGLRRITISLDALDPALFRQLSGGRGELSDVLAGIAAAEDAGFERLKFNCVVQRSEEHTSELQSLMRISSSVFGLQN